VLVQKTWSARRNRSGRRGVRRAEDGSREGRSSPTQNCSRAPSPRKERHGRDKPRSTQSVGSPKELHQHLLLIPKALPRKTQLDKAARFVMNGEQAGIIRMRTSDSPIFCGFQYRACRPRHHPCVRSCSSLAILAQDPARHLGAQARQRYR
jgi:hypothetical protein